MPCRHRRCAEVQEQYRKRGWAIGDMNRVEQCRGDAYMQAMAEQVGEGCRMYGNLQARNIPTRWCTWYVLYVFGGSVRTEGATVTVVCILYAPDRPPPRC